MLIKLLRSSTKRLRKSGGRLACTGPICGPQCLWKILPYIIVCVLTACGGGGSGGTSSPENSIAFEITSPTSSGSYATDCNTVHLAGSMGLGANAHAGQGASTDTTIMWNNQTNQTGGTARVDFDTCSGSTIPTPFPGKTLCNWRWSADVPLVVGSNRIVAHISDSANRTGQAVLTVDKSQVTYSVSGKVTTVSGTPLDDPWLDMSITSRFPGPINSDGTYLHSCLVNGSYSIAPTYSQDPLFPANVFSPTFKLNLVFAPSSRTVTIADSDVTGQDFAAQAWVISGAAGSGSGITVRLLTSSGSTIETSTRADGTFSFLAPNGAYTVSAGSFNEVFLPTSRLVTVTGSDVPGVNFASQR